MAPAIALAKFLLPVSGSRVIQTVARLKAMSSITAINAARPRPPPKPFKKPRTGTSTTMSTRAPDTGKTILSADRVSTFPGSSPRRRHPSRAASLGLSACRTIRPTSAAAEAMKICTYMLPSAMRRCRSTNKVPTIPARQARKPRIADRGSMSNASAATVWKRLVSAPNGRTSSTKRKEATTAIAPNLPPHPIPIGAAERLSSSATTKNTRPQTMDSATDKAPVALSLSQKIGVIPANVPP